MRVVVIHSILLLILHHHHSHPIITLLIPGMFKASLRTVAITIQMDLTNGASAGHNNPENLARLRPDYQQQQPQPSDMTRVGSQCCRRLLQGTILRKEAKIKTIFSYNFLHGLLC